MTTCPVPRITTETGECIPDPYTADATYRPARPADPGVEAYAFLLFVVVLISAASAALGKITLHSEQPTD